MDFLYPKCLQLVATRMLGPGIVWLYHIVNTMLLLTSHDTLARIKHLEFGQNNMGCQWQQGPVRTLIQPYYTPSTLVGKICQQPGH